MISGPEGLQREHSRKSEEGTEAQKRAGMWVGNNLKGIMKGRTCNSSVIEKSKIMRSYVGFSLTQSFNERAKIINFNICYYGLD